MELIDKAALVEKLKEWMYRIELGAASIPLHGRERADAAFEYELLGKVKDFVNTFDTLETKDVDLEKEIDSIWNPRFNHGWDDKSLLSINHEGFASIAKYFYNLGLKAKENKL